VTITGYTGSTTGCTGSTTAAAQMPQLSLADTSELQKHYHGAAITCQNGTGRNSMAGSCPKGAQIQESWHAMQVTCTHISQRS
jgi:hypothetical protein